MSDDVSTIPNPGFRGSRAGRYGMGPQPKPGMMDSEMKKMVLIAGGLVAVIASFFAISHLRGHQSTGVPIITADSRPIRVKPENPGGMKIDGAENDVFSGGTDTSNAKLAPPAEAPDTKALRVDPSAEAPAVGEPAVQPPAPVAQATPKQAVPAPKPIPQASAPVAQSKPLVLAGLASPTAKPPPAPTAVPQQGLQPAALAKPAQPVVPPVGSQLAAKTAAPAQPAAHKAAVQLAALGTEEAAHAEWQILTKKMPDLLNGRQPVFTKTERDGHVFWRVRVSGFSDTTQGKTFCDQVKAKGGGCSVAEF